MVSRAGLAATAASLPAKSSGGLAEEAVSIAQGAVHVGAATALGAADFLTGGRVSPAVTSDRRLLADAASSARSWSLAATLIPAGGLMFSGVRTATTGLVGAGRA